MPPVVAVIAVLLAAAAMLPSPCGAERLPDTGPLTLPKNIVSAQLEQVLGYLSRRIDQARTVRDRKWNPDFSSPEAYQKSVAPHRARCRAMLGLVDRSADVGQAKSEPLGSTDNCRIERITIPMSGGLNARGMLFAPTDDARHPAVIVCPDADTWPEKLAGVGGDAPPAGWLGELVARGAVVYVMQSVERLEDHPYCKTTKGKDRRMILHRLGYIVGLSVVGMDVQDAAAAIDYLSSRADVDPQRIAMAGIDQGGMTALYTAAVDPRVAATVVGGYFQVRDRCWEEPFDRRLPGRLLEFGDAEVAALVAPRLLSVLHWPRSPIVRDRVTREVQRTERFYEGLKATDRLALSTDLAAADPPTRCARLAADALELPQPQGTVACPAVAISEDKALAVRNAHFEERMKHLRELIQQSEAKRQKRWAITSRPASEFKKTRAAMLEDYRKLVGRVPIEGTPIRPRTELALITDKYKAYRVTLDVAEDVQVYGNLLVPRDIKGRTAAVICQHGLNGQLVYYDIRTAGGTAPADHYILRV